MVEEQEASEAYRKEQHITTEIVATAPTPIMAPRRKFSRGDTGLYLLAFTMLLGYYALIAGFMFGDIEQGRQAPIKEILNYMTPLIGVMIGYFFGGALSGRRKDDMIASVVAPQ